MGPSNGLRAGRRARDATERLLEGPGEEDELPLRGDAVAGVGPVRVDLGVLNFLAIFQTKLEIAEPCKGMHRVDLGECFVSDE